MNTGISLIFSQLIYDGEHLDLTHFAYAHYYLLSVYLLQDTLLAKHLAKLSCLLTFIIP